MSLGLGYTSSALAALLRNLHEVTERISERTTPRLQETRAKLQELTDEVRKDLLEHTTISTKYTHLLIPKKRWQLFLVSAIIGGIELAYSAETAFVSPILLKIGIPASYMSLIWCLSPLIGLVLVPIMGSWSDNCGSRFGRRRPFIFALSLGIIFGLVMVPNGKYLGAFLGGYVTKHQRINVTSNSIDNFSIPAQSWSNISHDDYDYYYQYYYENQTYVPIEILPHSSNNSLYTGQVTEDVEYKVISPKARLLTILFTCLGVVVLDFCSDASQSPSRAYMLDICLPTQHTTGLSAFTIIAGTGGSFGYMLGAIDWGKRTANILKSGGLAVDHYRMVFSIILVLFCICLLLTITSFKELPLTKPPCGNAGQPSLIRIRIFKALAKFTGYFWKTGANYLAPKNNYSKLNEVSDDQNFDESFQMIKQLAPESRAEFDNYSSTHYNQSPLSRGHSISTDNSWVTEGDSIQNAVPEATPSNGKVEITKEKRLKPPISFKSYLKSIIKMPRFLQVLCVTNLFSWMSLVCYSLYFTDYVGQHIFGGDPKSPENSESHKVYERGLRFGCWGMATYSLTCAIYSYSIEALVKKLGAKKVYIGGQLAYSIGILVMALSRSKAGVILLSPSPGIMYATLFTMPYILVTQYHQQECIDSTSDRGKGISEQIRGLGTDVAIVSSMVFWAQFMLSTVIGSMMDHFGTTAIVPYMASILSLLGAVCASRINYPKGV